MTDAGARNASLASQEFVRFALECGVLRFGEFVTKAGRVSPYFFNAGLFNDGEKMDRLAAFYAHAILGSGIGFDMLFGPAYKGIPLAVTVAVELARRGRNVPWAYNRKEAKDHGEGGVLVGAPVRGRVLIVDDVISAGTALRESVDLIQAAGAQVCGVAIALDRQEKGVEGGQDTSCSAVQHIQRQMNVPVCAIAGFDDLVHYLQNQATTGAEQACMARIIEYRRRYGVTSQPGV